MKLYNKKGKVIKDFNDKETSRMYEIGEDFEANRFRYDDLQAKGFLAEGEEIKNRNSI